MWGFMSQINYGFIPLLLREYGQLQSSKDLHLIWRKLRGLVFKIISSSSLTLKPLKIWMAK